VLSVVSPHKFSGVCPTEHGADYAMRMVEHKRIHWTIRDVCCKMCNKVNGCCSCTGSNLQHAIVPSAATVQSNVTISTRVTGHCGHPVQPVLDFETDVTVTLPVGAGQDNARAMNIAAEPEWLGLWTGPVFG
jgi:hypothetical protein